MTIKDIHHGLEYLLKNVVIRGGPAGEVAISKLACSIAGVTEEKITKIVEWARTQTS